MYSTKLQVPIDQTILNQGKIRAKQVGFNSLNDAVRLFVYRFSVGEVDFSIKETASSVKIEEYNKMAETVVKDVKKGKSKAHIGIKSIMKTLNG